jgi:hypothetical protein
MSPGRRETEKPWVAVIGDVVRSRRLDRSGRAAAQRALFELVAQLDAASGPQLGSRFTITTGDEFQGLLRTPEPIPELLWAIQVGRREVPIRVGIGRGALFTPLRNEAVGMDGPVFHAARDAIDASRLRHGDRPVFAGFGDGLDGILTGIAAGLSALRARWTERQLEVARSLRPGTTQIDAARALGVSPQAVHQHVASAGLHAHDELEAALGAALRLAEDGR